jgi:serine/threonine protein kinase
VDSLHGLKVAGALPGSPPLNGNGSSSSQRPDCFGPFQVRADLGAKRFGPVYAGRDASANTRVVIHTFALSQQWRAFGELSDLLDAFRQLCETKLEHPSLARPLAFGTERDIPYIVYSDLGGAAMDSVMQQGGGRPVAEVLQRTRQLADAIDVAARSGVHHGMLTPSDVILEGERTGVSGFGLAQALIKAGIPAEAVSPYGSPQRLAGAPPTLADDVYALAAITLELLIGTPREQDQDTSRALREAQGLPERRRIPRPAPHETRAFTTLPGADAGKLRAAFAAAFAEEPGSRPSTAAEFFVSFERGFSIEPATDDTPSKPVFVPNVSREQKNPPSAPVVELKDPEDAAPLDQPNHQEHVAAEKQEAPATSPSIMGKPHEHKRRKRKRERRPPRPQPIVAVPQVEVAAPRVEIAAPRVDIAVPRVDIAVPRVEVAVPQTEDVVPVAASSMDTASSGIWLELRSRALVIAMVVVISATAGFSGGFVVGRRSTPSTESTANHREKAAAPRLPPAAVVDPQPIAPTTQTTAPAANEPQTPTPEPTAPALDSGRLLIRSTPAGASVMVDGQSHGLTPLSLRELGLRAYTIEVSYPDHDTRRRRVTLSGRRPARTVDFNLRPRSVPADGAAATDAPGSLQVTSRPSGAQVFVDDTMIGTTPLLLSDVAAGSRRLRVELPGYETFTAAVEIKPGSRSRVVANLEP